MNDTTKTARPLPTAEEVRALLDYDPETGLFRWRQANTNRVRVGGVAGTVSGRYRKIGVGDKQQYAHRLAWLVTHGEWPASDLDHRDGDCLNNRIANLRLCNMAENAQNKRSHRGSTSKYLGVSWSKLLGKWTAQIHLSGKKHHLGCFSNEEDASAAYARAKAVLHTFNPIVRDGAHGR
jgi:hypothetical protein